MCFALNIHCFICFPSILYIKVIFLVVDTSADDSGISQSLNSDADSSVPSLNSDYKTMSDSGCQEDIYCNVSGGIITSSFSTPVISSSRTVSALETNRILPPTPLPRLSLKRKAVLTSEESLSSSIYPSCGLLVFSSLCLTKKKHDLFLPFRISSDKCLSFLMCMCLIFLSLCLKYCFYFHPNANPKTSSKI